MKYFAKLLPYVGEILPGSQVIFKIGGEWSEPCDPDSLLGAPIEEVLPVKLFLCSRDIQVGDKKCILPDSIYQFECTRIRDGYVSFTRHTFGEYNMMVAECFKVIGEVSPDATWVKEGDEFEEEQVAHKYSIENNEDEFILLKEWEDFVIKELKYKQVPSYLKSLEVAFKCPTCKHFH